jgi:RHS repeat-associated protein
LLAVLDHTNGVVVSFLRGLDLSSTLQGAGGVGGVLAVGAGPSAQCETMANTTHFTCYDGNGNVTALMNAATGEESARYERGPFAESVRETSPMAKLNPIRFNTQYADDVNGDMKYLFRDYQTQVGRWPSRDPIGELGERNIYAFVGNDLLNWVDLFGLYGGPFSWPSRPDPRPPQRPPDPDPPYNRPVPLPNPAKDTWRICCQPVTGASLVTHCDLRWYPCDFESSVEYPVTRNPKCCNKTIKSDYDMKKCFAKQSQGGGYLPWNNCQVDAWNALQNCCGKTRWTPSWYILQGGCPSEYITAP